jgi:hypothetical protein
MGRQAGDFLTYILLPLCCALLPYAWGQAVISTIARRGWLLEARSAAALAMAQRFVPVANEHRWKVRWRLTELIEPRDLWFSMLGRGKVLARAVRQQGMPELADNLVLIGMHWGPSVLALQLFYDAGHAPRFVYRQVNHEIRRSTPIHYLYLRLLVAYIRRVCAGREIVVPGARRELETAQREPGSPVILLDAPTTRSGRSIKLKVGNLEAEFNRDGAEQLVAGKSHCVLYSLGMDDSGANVLNCSEPFAPDSAEQLMQRFAGLMFRSIGKDSAQWRLWHAADQLFRKPSAGAKTPGSELNQTGPCEPDGAIDARV